LDYYIKGHPWISNFGYGDSISFTHPWTEWDSASFITMDVAASQHGTRLAVAWLWDDYRPEIYQNVYLKISEDNGLNWGPTINVTNIAPIDTNCFRMVGDANACNRDTLVPWIDCSVLFDDRDICHVAFSTWGEYYWWAPDTSQGVGPWILTARPSIIWQWDEQRREYNVVAERWYGYNGALGVNMLMCHRPNLAIDTISHYMYCSFQMHDTSQWNVDGRLSADAWITVSTDYGRNWAEPTDVTNTVTPQDAPPPGSMSERDVMIARYVTGGYVHMIYQIDHDCGTSITATPEGVPTLNEQIYQRIPVSDIPTAPLVPPYPFHADSSGYPAAVNELEHLLPGQFALYQNYPNPFNPATTIQFDLASESSVSLRVFDVLGREVHSILKNERLAAGAHVMSFDASALPSGVYFYRLETPRATQTRKMILMK
jgi:hypothetical protein